MSTSLYDLTNQYAEAFAKLSELDIDEQTIADTLEGLEGGLEDKFEAVAMYQQNLNEMAGLKAKRGAELVAQATAMSAKAARLFEYIDTSMRKAKKEKIECKYFDLSYRKLPASVQVVDQDKVPSEYIKTKETKSVDKNTAKAAMKSGVKIEGLKLIDDAKKLQIK